MVVNTITEAKAQLSALVDRAAGGEESIGHRPVYGRERQYRCRAPVVRRPRRQPTAAQRGRD